VNVATDRRSKGVRLKRDNRCSGVESRRNRYRCRRKARKGGISACHRPPTTSARDAAPPAKVARLSSTANRNTESGRRARAPASAGPAYMVTRAPASPYPGEFSPAAVSAYVQIWVERAHRHRTTRKRDSAAIPSLQQRSRPPAQFARQKQRHASRRDVDARPRGAGGCKRCGGGIR